MEGIYETNSAFPFDKLVLSKPVASSGGNYFIKFKIADNPLYIQSPKCSMKQGIAKAGKRFFCDLMFSQENEEFIHWMEKLEEFSQKYIYEHRSQWFETEIEMHDIENSFAPSMKVYKSGKYYLVRSHVPTVLGKCVLKIYDEYENEVNYETLQENANVITILEIQGIKCSARSFQIEIEMKQMLVLKPLVIFEKSVFKKKPVTTENDASAFVEKSLPPPLESLEENTSSSSLESLGENVDTIVQEPLVISTQESLHENTGSSSLESLNTTIQESLDENKSSSSEESLDEKSDPNESLEESPPSSTIELFSQNVDEPCEIDFTLDTLPEDDTFHLKARNDVYYKMYREAKRKAKISRDLALSSYLEAQRIKNTYMLDSIVDSDSDLDEESFNFETE
jgi:metal-responsive CopG/Arc/MetJ family transcriptional regulator